MDKIQPSDFCYAPEAIDLNIATLKGDIFAFAMVVFVLLWGVSRPFDGKGWDPIHHMKRLLEGWRPPIPDDALPLFKELITDCWRTDPEERPSAEELFNRISDSNFAIFNGVDPAEVRSYLSWCNKTQKQEAFRIATPRQILKTLRRADGVIPGIDLSSFDESAFNEWIIRCDRNPNAFRSPLISDWLIDLCDFREKGSIGRGRYGYVKLFEAHNSTARYAVKSLATEGGTDDRIQTLFVREIENLIKLDHPCVLRLKGYDLASPQSPFFKIVTEYMPVGSLSSVLKSSPNWWSPTAKAIVISGIVLGMRYVHSRKIIHRDLKPSNILLDEAHRIRIGDFGSSRFLSVGITQTANAGTPLYMAPEQYETDYDEKVDVYSFGLILYEIVVGKPVFDPSLSMPQLFRKAISGERAEIPATTLPFVKTLIERCWSVDPVSRPSFYQILLDLIKCDFTLFADADSNAVRRYVKSVEVFE
jgi:serine/threonine protein kinase